jgi:hypothetical protein
MSAPICEHPECLEARADGETSGCLDCCEHMVEIDSHHPCMECAMERAEGMADARREGL